MTEIFEYKKEEGVPRGHYYIEETVQFADFEIDEITKITFYSKSREKLIKLCEENNWACPDVTGSTSGWNTHHIKRR